jgi:phosphoribosylformylglycinamidine synthase
MLEEFSTRAARHGVPLTTLGRTGGDALVVEGQFEVPVAELRAAWSATLPTALG